MSLETELKKLKYSRLPFLWGKCHEALIGLWIDWWFSLNKKMLVNNSGRKIKDSNGRYRTADIFLCRFKKGIRYSIEGIAEVENTKSKWSEKLKTKDIKQKVIIAKFIKSNIAESRKEVYATVDMAGVGGDKQKDFFIWKPFTGEIEIIIYYNGNEKTIKVGKKLVGKGVKKIK